MITPEILRVLQNELVLVRNVNRQYDKSFANEGAKIGSTLRIRKPDRVLVSDGAALQAKGHVLVSVPEIGAATAIHIIGPNDFEAAAETVRRGGGSAMVVDPTTGGG